MLLFTIAFLVGDATLQSLFRLPLLYENIFLIVLCSTTYFYLRRRSRYSIIIIAFCLGFSWSNWYASQQLSWQLSPSLEDTPILLTGTIASLPAKQFTLDVDSIQNIKQSTHVRLAWNKTSTKLNVGDRWQFLVKLKRIHGTQNPGGFDMEAWALQQGLRAIGTVQPSKENHFLNHVWHAHLVDQWRQHLQRKILQHLPNSPTSPWLMALMIGERDLVNPEDWEVLQRTGTNHLMAIAGLHIGILSGLVYFITVWLWQRGVRIMLIFPAQQVGACVALMTAWLYSALAGFSIPTQRACIMLTFFMLASLLNKKNQAWHGWSLAMLLVLCLNPLSLLTESFWLSFGTIALIIYGMTARLSAHGLWWKWCRVQWVISIGLVPLSLLLFQEMSLISIVANSIAIPWLEFTILPLCLLSTIFLEIFPLVATMLLWLADKSLALLWIVLHWFAHLDAASMMQVMPSTALFLTMMIGVLLFLLPIGVPGRWFGFIWVLPIIFYQPLTPNAGTIKLTMLDVGQGLSVVIQTKSHIAVFDAGPALSASMDMGESVVKPYLNTLGVHRIDDLIISHGDNDHLGGAGALIKAFKITAIHSSVPNRVSPMAELCLAGKTWTWDGVIFTFLHPNQNTLNLGNDSSCVLRVSNGSQSVLLTGDIEKYGENELLKYAANQLSADILIAPHHGSKTSSSNDFVRVVHPRYVFYGTGYKNRYHFPHDSVVETYKANYVEQFATAETGAIMMRLEVGKEIEAPLLYREINKKYWSFVIHT